MDSSSTGDVNDVTISMLLAPESNAEGNTDSGEQVNQAAGEESPDANAEATTVDAPEEDIEAIKAKYQQQREIAKDPAASEAYWASKNAPPQEQQQATAPTPEATPAPTPSIDTLFGDEDFDPYQPQHVARVLQHTVEQQLQPIAQQLQYAVGYISQLQQQEAQAQVQQLDDFTYQEINKHVDGLGDLFLKDNLTTEEKVLATQFTTELQNTIRGWFPAPAGQAHPMWFNQEVISDALKVITPQLRGLASTLGIKGSARSGNPAIAKAVQADNTIESSSAIPSGNAFESAVKAGDTVAMTKALMS